MNAASPAQTAPVRERLGRRVRRAGRWALAGQVAGQAVRLGANVVVARMLSPDAFGLMSVVYMLTVALTLFSDLGLNRSIVQSPRGADPALLDTAWTLQVIRGAFLALATVGAAAVLGLGDRLGWTRAGTVYADPRLPWLIGAFAVNVQLSGLDSIRVGQAGRDVQVHRVVRIELGSQAVSAVLMVGAVWLTRSIWALVFGAVFSNALRVGLGYVFLPGHRERFRLERAAVAELMGNAKWIFLSSILGFLAANGDRVLLGGLVDSHAFGLYAVAVLLASVLQIACVTLSISVAYPAFSEVARERPADLPRTLAKFLVAYDLAVGGLAGLLVVAGPALVGLLYDRRYHESGWMLSVLAIGAIGLRSLLVEQCYQAVGKPQLMTFASLARLVALVAGIAVGYRVAGLAGVLAGIAASPFAAWPLAAWFLARRRALSWRANALLVPGVAGGALAGWLLSLALAWWLPDRPLSLKHML